MTAKDCGEELSLTLITRTRVCVCDNCFGHCCCCYCC